MKRGIKLLNKLKALNVKYLLIGIILLFFLGELFLFINNSVRLTNNDSVSLFDYVVKIRSASECLDKIFERAEVNLNVLTGSIVNSYNINKLNDKGYNFNYIKNIDPLIKSVLTNSPSVAGAWFQLNSDLPFSAWAFNWYEFKDNQFIDMNEKFQQMPSLLRQINPKEDPYYFNALESNGPVWSNLYKDADTGEEFLTVSAPVYKGNSLIGVAGLDVSKQNLNNALSNIHLIMSNVDLYILDENSNLILSQMTNGLPASDDISFLKKVKINKETPVVYYSNLTKRTAVSIILSNNYKLVVSVKNKDIFVGENALEITTYVLFILFVLTLAFILFIFFKDEKDKQSMKF